MTKQDISVLLGILRAAYPKFYDGADKKSAADAVDLWFEMLSDIDLNTAKIAFKRHIATNKWPPSPAEIRESISAVIYLPLPTSGDAWGEVKTAIRLFGSWRELEALEFMSDLTRQTVQKIGWQTVCIGDNEVADRAHFFKIYETMNKRIEQDRMLPVALRSEIQAIAERLSIESTTDTDEPNKTAAVINLREDNKIAVNE